MKSPLARFARLLMLALLLTSALAAGCRAAGRRGPSVLRDTETELLFKDMSRPLIKAAGLDPNSVKVVLLNDPEINAFVATGPDRLYPVRPARGRRTTSTSCRASSRTSSATSAGGHSIRSGQGRKQATGISIAVAGPRRAARSPPAPAMPAWAS